MIECHFCGQQLPDNAKFCYKCGQQIICKECGERLVKDAPICVVCGATLKPLRSVNAPNHIIFSESTTERKFEASFSDETAGNVVETLAGFLPINNKSKFNSSLGHKTLEVTPILAEHTIAPEVNAKTNLSASQCTINEANVSGHSEPAIAKIFKEKADGSIMLHITDLKANSKVDYAFRATLLYIYYQNEVSQISEVPKSDVRLFLKSLGFDNDGSYRGRISKMKSMFSSMSQAYSLSFAGENEAKTYIEQIMSPDTIGDWTIGNLSKTSATQFGNKKVSLESYSLVTSLNLSPNGKESLKDFLNKRNIKSAMELNALFVYYLEKVIGCSEITPDHVYTCYKTVNKRYPSKLRQSLADTKRLKVWIDTSDMGNLKIAPNGENFIEHDSLK